MLKGQSVKELEKIIGEHADRENTLIHWGIGDHGGGPSRVEYNGIS